MIKQLIKKVLPESSLRLLYKAGIYKNYKPRPGKLSMGDLNRLTPVSDDFGYDRGGPIDRYYIENFLQKESGSIKGRVLEIGGDDYTRMFGGGKVSQSDILHVDNSNSKATFVGDLSNAPQIPDQLFDCIIIVQTLHLIYDFKAALQTCHRLLKPGGTLLLTVPYITPLAHGQWKEIWLWAFTNQAMQRVMADVFPAASVDIKSYGNVFTATAFLYGMGISEVDAEKLQHHDEHYQVIVSVKATKA